MIKGKIIKGIAGFYYVSVESGIYECKAKGAFRNAGIKPMVGDNVMFEIIEDNEEEKIGNIEKILPRANSLIRPVVANVDQALIIFAVDSPKPNMNLMDRMILHMELNDLPVIICFNKSDLSDEEDRQSLIDYYRGTDYKIIFTNTVTGEGLDELRGFLKGKTTTVAGPSGVGKSTVINTLSGKVVMETGDISEKIHRGKHTTRHTQLIPLWEESYILDTPGFSSLHLQAFDHYTLKNYYPDFDDYACNCRFNECLHVSEPDCAVKLAVEEGRLDERRHDNYVLLYEEVKNIKRY